MTDGGPGGRRRLLRDVAVVVAVMLVLGAVAAVLWWQVVDPPRLSRSGGQVHVVTADLTRQVAVDGWYAVIALVGGLLSGIGLVAWRRTDPVVTVLVVTAGGCAAGWVMRVVGRLLGPESPGERLRAGASSAPAQLVLHAPGVVWLWPAAATAGCLLWLYLAGSTRQQR